MRVTIHVERSENIPGTSKFNRSLQNEEKLNRRLLDTCYYNGTVREFRIDFLLRGIYFGNWPLDKILCITFKSITEGK